MSKKLFLVKYNFKNLQFSCKLRLENSGICADKNKRLFKTVHYMCERKFFQKNYFLKYQVSSEVRRKNGIFNISCSVIIWIFGLWVKNFGVWKNNLQQGCQNCFLRVQRDYSIRSYFQKLSTFINSLQIFSMVEQKSLKTSSKLPSSCADETFVVQKTKHG